jgi:hypothetical protein
LGADQGCQIFLGTIYQREKNIPDNHKIYQCPQNIPNCFKIIQMAINYIYPHLPLQEPPKFTQIGISGLKICRLATLAQTT